MGGREVVGGEYKPNRFFGARGNKHKTNRLGTGMVSRFLGLGDVFYLSLNNDNTRAKM